MASLYLSCGSRNHVGIRSCCQGSPGRDRPFPSGRPFDCASLAPYRLRYAISVASVSIVKYRSPVRIDTNLTSADFYHGRLGAHRHEEASRAPKLLTTRKIDTHHPCWKSGEDASALILSWKAQAWVSRSSSIQSRYRGLEPRSRDHRPSALKSATPHRGFLSGGCLGRTLLLC